jgi:hypothetical protein
VTDAELIEKFVDETQPADLPDISYLLKKAIDFGYALAVSEGAGDQSGR